MSTTGEYRASLSQLDSVFALRYNGNHTAAINSVISPISHQQLSQNQLAAFSCNSPVSENDLRKALKTFRVTEERTIRDETQRSGGTDKFLLGLCVHGSDNCRLCFKTQTSGVKLKTDVSTMTDPEEQEPSSPPADSKVAEYLTSLRQFLKLSVPNERKKRQLGDVKIMTSGDGTRLFCCPECHVAYSDKSLLEPHLAGHKIERRWLCGVCGAGLKRKEHLDRHRLCHTDERPYVCTACPKAFKRNEHLTRHFIMHSGEKAQELKKKFTCGVCGSGHSRRELLERHEETHLEHRPFCCSQCGKAFKRNEHLSRHVITHSGLKPYSCNQCAKAFYRKDHLAKHTLSHNPKMTTPP